MSNQQHPITPPPELRCQWQSESPFKVISVEREDYMIDRAAQYGADQQLEECCEQLKSIPSPLGIPFGEMASNALRNACRPKPPSLKEQALEQLDEISNDFRVSHGGIISCDKIRKALEALPND